MAGASIFATTTNRSTPSLTDEQVRGWRERGFAFVSGLFEDELVARLRADAQHAYPAPGSAEAADLRDFGSGGRLVFPSASDAFNAVTLHPRLLGAIAQLLDVPTRELRLTQSDLSFERLIARASLEQRAVLGFPQPGSDYWCAETIAAVEARYGVYGMDMTPYRH